MVKPVVSTDGTLRNFTLSDSQGKFFFCNCGCNVFHKPDDTKLTLYKCNSCGTEYANE